MQKRIFDFIKSIKEKLRRKNCGELYYINGPENLPAPLTKEKEDEILTEIAKGDFNKRDIIEFLDETAACSA